MSFDPSKYKNQNHLKHSGKSLAQRLKDPTKKAISELNEITDTVEGDFNSSSIDYDEFLPRFWNNNSSLDAIEREFESKRERKNLIKGLNRTVNDKVILRDYLPFENIFKLLPIGDQSLKIFTNIYLNNLEFIQKEKNLQKAFQAYFQENLVPQKFTSNRVELIYNSKQFLTDYNGVKLFVEKRLKNFDNIDNVLRESGFNTANSDFKKLVSYQYLYTCYRNAQVNDFLKIYKNLLDFGDMTKRVIPLLVLLAKESHQLELKKLAEEKSGELIGNPLIKMKWTAPTDLKNEEVKRLEQARVTLSEWFIKSFIAVFFEQLAKDPRRKAYWLNHVSLIEDIRVYGNRTELNKFLKLFKEQYGAKSSNVIRERLNYYTNSDRTCGIVMNIGGYEIVEFTDTGALYCYPLSSNRIKRRIDNSKKLKHPKMDLAINADYWTAREGKIMHSGSWEDRVDFWIQKYAI